MGEGGVRAQSRWQKLVTGRFCCRILALGSPLVLTVGQVWWLQETSGATVFI